MLVTKEDAHLTCWLAQAGGAKQKAGIGIFGRKKSAWDGDGGGGGGGGAGHVGLLLDLQDIGSKLSVSTGHTKSVEDYEKYMHEVDVLHQQEEIMHALPGSLVDEHGDPIVVLTNR